MRIYHLTHPWFGVLCLQLVLLSYGRDSCEIRTDRKWQWGLSHTDPCECESIKFSGENVPTTISTDVYKVVKKWYHIDCIDKKAPIWETCPNGILVQTELHQSQAIVNWQTEAFDKSGEVTVTCDVASGSTFAIGQSEVTCVAIDRSGNNSTCSFNVTVEDIDECAAGADNCDVNALCSNTDGSFTCACNSGYDGGGTSCTDIDECATGADNCEANAGCSNTIGSFTCTCNPGYEAGGIQCSDIDECATQADNCDVSALCSNTEGSFTCTCNSGYDSSGTTCTDIDECATGADNCDVNALCSNTDGSFTCICNSGYEGGGIQCSDIDECATGTDNCEANAGCSNTEGSFTCTCNSGYEGDGIQCSDIDECATQADNCDVNALCSNTEGNFICTCNSGYNGGGIQCSDIDECATGADNCDVNALCSNTEGSFTCICNSGYDGDGIQCSDIDECATGADNCDVNALCSNTDGSFTCTCNSGFNGDGTTTCSEINECATGADNCDTNAQCSNTDGSFTCTCNPGYNGDGSSCSDIDECADGAECYMSDSNAQCVNLAGGFKCICNAGSDCVEICTQSTSTCDKFGTATCPAVSCKELGETCQKPSGVYYVRREIQTFYHVYQVFCDMETFDGGWARFGKGSLWNYQNEDEVTATIDIIPTSDTTKIQNLQFTEFRIFTDVEFRLQADNSVNPSSLRFVTLSTTGLDLVLEGEMIIGNGEDHTRLVFNTEGDKIGCYSNNYSNNCGTGSLPAAGTESQRLVILSALFGPRASGASISSPNNAGQWFRNKYTWKGSYYYLLAK